MTANLITQMKYTDLSHEYRWHGPFKTISLAYLEYLSFGYEQNHRASPSANQVSNQTMQCERESGRNDGEWGMRGLPKPDFITTSFLKGNF